MRILHVIRSLDPRCGGPPTVVRNLAKEQVRLGHEVTILTTTAQEAFAEREPRAAHEQKLRDDPSYAGVEIFFAKAYAYGPKPLVSFAYAPQLKSWLHRRVKSKEKRPEVIHLHGFFEYGAVVAAKMARRYSIPYFIEPYGSLDSVPFQRRSRWLKHAYMHLLFRGCLEGAECIHPSSEHEVLDVQRWVPHARVQVIPHGTNIPDVDIADSAQRFREKYPRLKDKRVILFFSRMASIKRPEWLVEALARLRSEFPDLVLLFAGSRIDHTAVVEAMAEKLGVNDLIVDAGFLQGEDIQGAFSVADVFALPSVNENFAVAVIEAMAHGIPVLVTPGVASHVYVDASGGGLTVQDDFEAVVTGLRQLLQSDKSTIGERGRQYVQNHLTWKSIAKQVDQLYETAFH